VEDGSVASAKTVGTNLSAEDTEGYHVNPAPLSRVDFYRLFDLVARIKR